MRGDIANLRMDKGFVTMRNKLNLAIPDLLLLISGVQAMTCTADQKHPNGKPDNFDINSHLKQFKTAGNAASRLPLGGLTARASIMASMFAPNRKYDLKNNPNMTSSQEFGNWFYGAAAAQMGFTKQQALAAGAIVQQWQNYGYTNHPDHNDIGKLASNIVHAIRTGKGDNPDDAVPISGGHSYSTDVYNKDQNSDSNDDSCQDNSSNTSGGGSGDFGGGWDGGVFIGVGGCYGNCAGGGSGTVTIKDLPRQQDAK